MLVNLIIIHYAQRSIYLYRKNHHQPATIDAKNGFTSKMTHYDTIIVGGGIVGAATAYALATSGQKILLLDQFEPGHTRGSSHGDGRIIRFNYPEAVYVQMARLAYAAWDRLSNVARQPLTQKTGIAECGPADNPQIAEQIANFEETGVPYEAMDGTTYMQHFPQVKVPTESVVLLQPDGGAVFATPAVLALWRLIAALGAETLSGQRVTQIDATDAGVTVHAINQTWEANKVVIAAGGWTNTLLKLLGIMLPLEVTQEQLAYFAPKDDTDHRLGSINAMLDWHHDPPFYCIPQIEIAGIKVGWHHTGNPINPDQPRFDNQDIINGMSAWVGERFPHLHTTPLQTVTCLYTNTPDYHFVLDTHPMQKNVVIGAGFSGHGFKFGPTIGEILAALVKEEAPPLDVSTFSIARFNDPSILQKRTGA